MTNHKNFSRLLRYPILVLALTVRSVVLSIMVPETFLEMVAAQRGNGERSFILDDLLEIQDKKLALASSMPCIESFLEQYFVEAHRASLWISDDLTEDVELQGTFLKTLRTQIPFYLLEKLTAKGKHRTAAYAIILVGDSYSLENTTARLVFLCGRNCNFLTILATPFQDEASFLEEADATLNLAWSKHSVVRMVVLGSVRGSVLLAGSISFKPDEVCTLSPAILLDHCENSHWDQFKGFQLPSLNQCIINLGYCDLLPYSAKRNDSSDRVTGIEGVMVEVMMSVSDAQLSRQEIPWDDNTSLLEEVIQWKEDGSRLDLVICGLLWDPTDNVDYTTTYEEAQVVWLVPITTSVSLEGLVSPFHPYIWAAVGAVLILGVLIRIFLIRNITCLSMLALILGVGLPRQPSRSSSRILFISWAIYGFCLTQFYLASLAQQLIDSSGTVINEVDELAVSQFIPAGTDVFADIIEDHMDDDEVLRQIYERFVTFERNEYLVKLADLLAGRNTTFALMVQLNATQARNVLPPTVHIMEESMGTYPIALATWNGEPYLDLVNEQIQTFIEMGLVQFYSGYFAAGKPNSGATDEDDNAESSSELRIQQFVPAFLLMSIGFGVGLLFFIAEMIFYPSKWLE